MSRAHYIDDDLAALVSNETAKEVGFAAGWEGRGIPDVRHFANLKNEGKRNQGYIESGHAEGAAARGRYLAIRNWKDGGGAAW